MSAASGTTDVSLPGVTTVREGGLTVVRRGLALSPSIRVGLPFTILLAVLSTAGGAVVPVLIQRTIDAGLADGGVSEEPFPAPRRASWRARLRITSDFMEIGLAEP